MRNAIILLSLAAVALPAFPAGKPAPSQLVAGAMRDALTADGVAPDMSVVERPAAELRRVVSRNLGPGLLSGALEVVGRDFQFRSSARDRQTHIGVIALRYSSPAVARRQASRLAPRQDYFRNTKILTRFAAITLDRLLVVVYSENSGDSRVVKALGELPSRFREASENGVGEWREPPAYPLAK